MQEVDSQVLQRVSKALQLSTRGAQRVDFQDEVLQQVLDVGPLIRRGGTGFAGGVLGAQLQNVHTGADSRQATMDPYAEFEAAYGAQVGQSCDAWIFGALLSSTTSANYARNPILYLNVTQAVEITSGISTYVNPLAIWALAKLDVAGFATAAYLGGSLSYGSIAGLTRPVRIPRGGIITLNTESAGAETVSCQVTLGFFPEGMGQDGAV